MTVDEAKCLIKKELYTTFASETEPLKRVLYLALFGCIDDKDWERFLIPEIKEQYTI